MTGLIANLGNGTNRFKVGAGCPDQQVIVSSGGGQDEIGFWGNDTDGTYVDSGGGNDEVTGSTGPDEIHAGDGNDEILGLYGNDKIFGGRWQRRGLRRSRRWTSRTAAARQHPYSESAACGAAACWTAAPTTCAADPAGTRWA